MTLLEKMLQEILDRTADKTDLKIKRFADRLCKEKDLKIKKMKQRNKRGILGFTFPIISSKCSFYLELRRLEREYNGVSTRYHKPDIIQLYADYGSELYAPLLRNGLNPKYRNIFINLHGYHPLLIGK